MNKGPLEQLLFCNLCNIIVDIIVPTNIHKHFMSNITEKVDNKSLLKRKLVFIFSFLLFTQAFFYRHLKTSRLTLWVKNKEFWKTIFIYNKNEPTHSVFSEIWCVQNFSSIPPVVPEMDIWFQALFRFFFLSTRQNSSDLLFFVKQSHQNNLYFVN